MNLNKYNVEAEFGLFKVSAFELFDAAKIQDTDPAIVERRLNAVLGQRKTDTHALTYRGIVELKIHPEEAAADFDKAIQFDPENALAHFYKGVLLDRKGSRDEALRHYTIAAEKSEWNQVFLNNLAYQYFQRGDYALAESKCTGTPQSRRQGVHQLPDADEHRADSWQAE